jgi:predicted metal-dependent phosphoesterase TrpH
LSALIDLHSHTDESDGTFSPAQLIDEAVRAGLTALGITDHDTFAGYDRAVPLAREAGLELICGIELSTKLQGRSIHLLGYFFKQDGLQDIRDWVLEMQAARRDRNIRLIARLQSLGFDMTLEEVQARGRGLTARPHFAQVMLEKGYVTTLQQAFDDYLDESAKGYVYRQEPQFAEAVERIRSVGGIASLAHPVRIKIDLAAILPELWAGGLNAIEVYHSDHNPQQVEQYLGLAERHALMITGGSDFHGAAKPGILLGTGRGGNLQIPYSLLENLRAGQPAGSGLVSQSINSQSIVSESIDRSAS